MSLHQRIHDDLEQKILSGAWPPGHRLPFESELMAQYGCARMTVNKVMAGLAASGRILRRRRAGSFVADRPAESAVLQIPDMQADIAARGAVYSYKLLSQKAQAKTPPDFLVGHRLLALTCLHLAGTKPFALERRLISLDSVPEAAGVDFTTTPPGSWLLQNIPWTQAEHGITAINANAATAKTLALAPGAACLAVTRQTWRATAPITWVEQIFPGGVYRLTANFSP